MKQLLIVCAALSLASSALAALAPEATPFLPGHVSTAATEVRITFSPDGRRMLWGTIGWTGGAGGWDIYESVKTGDTWSKPQSVSFNTKENDFDPFFAPDGSGVYFFSNRQGGLGKDDIYFVPFDSKRGTYGTPRNLGPEVNSAGSEWAPALSSDGKFLIFSSDGRGGEGKQDLFMSVWERGAWTRTQAFGPPVNGPNDDFDATFMPSDTGIIMSSGDVEGDVKLYMSVMTPGGFVKPQLIGSQINCDAGLTLGPAVARHDPKSLYFTSNCRKNGVGRMDIFRAPLPEYDFSRERNVH